MSPVTKNFCRIITVLLIIAAFSHATTLAVAQDAAKRDGEVVFYASMNLGEANALIGEFEKRYPFIKVKLNRATSEKLLTRVLAEARAKTREGQRLMQTPGRLVARADLSNEQAAMLKGLEIVPVDPALAEKLDEYAKQLRSILVAKRRYLCIGSSVQLILFQVEELKLCALCF